jgi:ribonuclease PH
MRIHTAGSVSLGAEVATTVMAMTVAIVATTSMVDIVEAEDSTAAEVSTEVAATAVAGN